MVTVVTTVTLAADVSVIAKEILINTLYTVIHKTDTDKVVTMILEKSFKVCRKTLNL